MKVVVYGIPNCDTTKKTINWLKGQSVDFVFHDYKKKGISKTKLNKWCLKIDWEVLLNKRGTTWRELSVADQQKVTNQAAAVKVMTEHNSSIKRPVIEAGSKLLVGFNEMEFIKHLK